MRRHSMAVDAHAAASAALWAFVKEANCGADMIPAHTFLSTHAVTASTKNFIVQSVTLSIGSTSCGYGGTVPLNMEDMEASPDLLIGYLPPRMAGKKVGHFVALLDVSMEVPLARVEKAETESFYTGVVSVGEGGAKYRVMDIGMYPWGLGRVGHTMDTSISTWAASLGVHALAKHTHATHMRTHSTHTHTHMYAHRSPGKLHMTRLRSSLGVETLEHLMRISIEGPELGTAECESLIKRALDHWLGIKERRMNREW
jgi:hypothetical protein